MTKLKRVTAVDEPVTVITRRLCDLGDFIYDSETVQLKDETHLFTDLMSERRFSLLDLVIIEGDPCVECWQDRYYQVHTLLRTAIAAKKRVIGIGLGAHLIGLYAATNGLRYDRLYRVVPNARKIAVTEESTYSLVFIDQDTGE